MSSCLDYRRIFTDLVEYEFVTSGFKLPEGLILRWFEMNCYVINPSWSKFKEVILVSCIYDVTIMCDFLYKNGIHYRVINHTIYIEDESCITLLRLAIKDVEFRNRSFEELVQPFFNFAEKHNIRLRYADDVCA